ncbi:hypothetical protein PMZ80_002952 [Knufia obscura]|uniref:Uncharacterized protein n=2 Tax=Knufia TaxID=430999 RepID=A0AAN8ILS7_9EURO|nr:hypothetical protein PMZ80_002952 [Knufia obscura]KAK5952462.1 hypothetical protein OHC33_006505 [Knufia fluminis]
MNAGFMDGPYWNDDQLQVDYYLGPMNRTNEFTDYTFRQYGEPFKWGVTAYSVNVYQSTPYPDIDSWEPLSDLKREDGTYLSVLFVASCRIKYTGPSDDYIFPATRLFKNGPYYYNFEPVSRPLACIDSSEVCSSDGNCSRIDQEHRSREREYEFVRAALRRSTTYQSIQSRLGNALNATEKIRDTVSYELDNNQWRIESEALFRTSLARIQHDALDIAVGFGQESPSYGNDSLDWIKSNTLCGLYKFNLPKGYTNVNVLGFFGLLALVAIVACLCVHTDVKFDENKDQWFQGHMMGFELVLWLVWSCLTLDFEPISQAWKDRKQTSVSPTSAPPHSGASLPGLPPPGSSPPNTMPPNIPPNPPPPPSDTSPNTAPPSIGTLASSPPSAPPSPTPPPSTLPPATQPASVLSSHASRPPAASLTIPTNTQPPPSSIPQPNAAPTQAPSTSPALNASSPITHTVTNTPGARQAPTPSSS